MRFSSLGFRLAESSSRIAINNRESASLRFQKLASKKHAIRRDLTSFSGLGYTSGRGRTSIDSRPTSGPGKGISIFQKSHPPTGRPPAQRSRSVPAQAARFSEPSVSLGLVRFIRNAPGRGDTTSFKDSVIYTGQATSTPQSSRRDGVNSTQERTPWLTSLR